MPPARIAAAAGVAVASLSLCGFAAQRAAAPSPPPRLEGTVRDAAGKPLEKALVLARPVTGDRTERTAIARTDAAGRFTMSLPRTGDYFLRVEAPGLAPHTIDRLKVPAAPLAVTLRKGAALEGVVRDARGKPVAGARVDARAAVRTGTLLAEPEAGRVRGTTDAKGAFRLEGLGTKPHLVTASAPGLGGATRAGVMPGTKLELFLTPGAGVRGIVRGPDRRPLAGAAVVIEHDAIGASPGVTERTDDAGAFQTWGLAAGAWNVVAFHPDFAPTVMPLVLERSDDRRVDLTLGAASRVRGRLVDAEQRPLSGTLILQELDGQVVRRSLGEMLRAESDAQGRFTLERLPRAPLALAATVRGFTPRRVEATATAADVDLGDVVLEQGLAVRGRVRDAAGSGIADAQVRVMQQAMGPRRMPAEGVTEADGRFVVAGLEPGLYSVTANASGHGSATARTNAGGEAVDLVLQRAGSITGTVVDEKGGPVPLFDVSASPVEEAEDRRSAWGEGTDGRFVLEDVAAGDWVLQVKAQDKAEARVSGVKVRMGAATDVGRVRLTPGASVRGRVTDGAGTPVPGVNVWADLPERYGPVLRSGRRGGFSDLTGAFELLGLSAGRYDLVADHPEFARTRVSGVDVDPARGATEARITLARGGRVEGTVRRRDGRPVERASVRVASMASGSAMAQGAVAPDGTYAVEHVSPGPARVMLQVGTGDALFSTTQAKPVEVREGETATADFLLRDILLSGTVTRRGEPAPGVKITLRSMSMGFFGAPPGLVQAPPVGPQRGWAVTRPDGGYELLLDDPGTYMVSATSADGRINYPMRTIEVADADSSTVDLAYGGVVVSGQVVDAETSAPVSATVYATPAAGEDRRPANTHAGADGRFQLEVEPGELTMSAMAQGYAAGRATVTVGESGLADVRLALPRGASISGRVLDGGGRPVPSLMVTAFPAGDLAPNTVPMSRMGFTRSAADGTFTISSLSEGRYSLRAGDELAGYGSATDVASGATGVVLRLQPGGRVRATVLRPDGSPAPGVLVTVAKVDGRPSMGGRPGHTDASGVAELATPAGTLEMWAGDMQVDGLASVAVSPGETASVEIRLKPKAAGAGTR